MLHCMVLQEIPLFKGGSDSLCQTIKNLEVIKNLQFDIDRVWYVCDQNIDAFSGNNKTFCIVHCEWVIFPTCLLIE